MDIRKADLRRHRASTTGDLVHSVRAAVRLHSQNFRKFETDLFSWCSWIVSWASLQSFVITAGEGNIAMRYFSSKVANTTFVGLGTLFVIFLIVRSPFSLPSSRAHSPDLRFSRRSVFLTAQESLRRSGIALSSCKATSCRPYRFTPPHLTTRRLAGLRFCGRGSSRVGKTRRSKLFACSRASLLS